MSSQTNQAAKGFGWGPFFAGFLPGLLQFQLGQRSRAVVAFASCTALYCIGWMVVGPRLFYWALLDGPGTATHGALTLTLPELLNLPAHLLGGLLAYDGSPTGLRMERLPRAMEHAAAWLTGASGMLAAFWSAAAHWQLRLRRDGGAEPKSPIADPALCALLSWLVPGLGHARAGQASKGWLMGAAVLVVFVIGMVFGGGHSLDRADAPVWWMAQNLFGGGSLFAALITGPMERASDPLDLQMGIVVTTVAGLMNLVVMVDAFTVAERSVFPLRMGAPEGAAA